MNADLPSTSADSAGARAETGADALADASEPPITRLLALVSAGDRQALDAVYESLYPELKSVARSRLRQQGRADQMNTTRLVHESFIRLVNARGLRLLDRHHFFAYAAKTMRHIIIDDARELLAERRGGGMAHLTLGAEAEAVEDPSADNSAELLGIDEALKALEKIDPELAELVEMRYFGGYSEIEVGELLGVTERTVRRRWDKARAWLYVALGKRAG